MLKNSCCQAGRKIDGYKYILNINPGHGRRWHHTSSSVAACTCYFAARVAACPYSMTPSGPRALLSWGKLTYEGTWPPRRCLELPFSPGSTCCSWWPWCTHPAGFFWHTPPPSWRCQTGTCGCPPCIPRVPLSLPGGQRGENVEVTVSAYLAVVLGAA